VLEVCGFNDWLIRLLQEYRCHKVILIQPEERKKRKTDRRRSAQRPAVGQPRSLPVRQTDSEAASQTATPIGQGTETRRCH